MRSPLKYSLRGKLLGLVFLILASFTAGTLWEIMNSNASQEEEAFNIMESSAKLLGESISTHFAGRYNDVRGYALHDGISHLDKSVIADLNAYAHLSGHFDLLMVVDLKGHLVLSNTRSPKGKDLNLAPIRDRDYSHDLWFKEVVAGHFTEDKAKGLENVYFEDFIVDPYTSAVYGESRYGSSFSTPVLDDHGVVVGVLTARANASWFEAALVSAYDALKAKNMPSAEVTVANGKGDVISQYDPTLTGKSEVTHDPEVLLKYNLKEAGSQIYAAAEKSGLGKTWGFHTRKKIEQGAGFFRIDSPKWVNSIGWTLLVRDAKTEILAEVHHEMYQNLFVLFCNIFLGLTMAVWFGVVISKQIDSQISVLSENSAGVANAAQSIAAQATQLSESSTEQAAALQETMAAVDEINAMVQKNSEAASSSQKVSAESRGAAERGRSTVTDMISAIDDINTANEDVAKQLAASNARLSEITAMINEIGNKTKVINEIVFQTKLLSFNASVEAARAGEAGKGFAVVAEEVGSLAQMSGAAAKEISDLLEKSVRQVETIVAESKSRVENMVAQSRQKVEVGTRTARECNDALEAIMKNVSDVDGLVGEIAVASQEQAQGIAEISKAVAQMDQVTQQNSAVAQQSSASAAGLGEQANELDQVVGQLVTVVRGEGESLAATAPEAVPASAKRGKAKSGKDAGPAAKPARAVNAKVATPAKEKGKVLAMPKVAPRAVAAASAPLKKVSGGFDGVPASDHPGFED